VWPTDVLAVVREDKALKAGDTSRMAQLIEEKIAPHFDFQRMTRLAVGRSWRQATPEQQAQLVTEFRALLVRSYSKRLQRIQPHRSRRQAAQAAAE